MGESPGLPRRFSHSISRSFWGPTPAPSLVLTPSPPHPASEIFRTPSFPSGFSRTEVTFLPSLLLCLSAPAPQVQLCPASQCLNTASRSWFLPLRFQHCLQAEKNAISCVTVHHFLLRLLQQHQPLLLQHHGHTTVHLDTTASLPTAVGTPGPSSCPLKNPGQRGVLVECDSLGPGNSGQSCQKHLWRLVFCFLRLKILLQEHLISPGSGSGWLGVGFFTKDPV